MGKNGTQGMTRSRIRFESPSEYDVIMHNDDFTTMDFVVSMLMNVFFKDKAEATRLMLEVHHHGKSVIGTYSYDIALSKANKAMAMAKEQGFPFRLTVEPSNMLPF